MISDVVFFYSNTLKSMLMGYAVIDMGCFGYYSYAAPRSKSMRGNVINTFLFHVAQCITFRQTNIVTETLIAKESLKSFYPSLGFKVIEYFATSTHFEEDRKQFNYDSGKSKALQKQSICLKCHQTIQRRVKHSL